MDSYKLAVKFPFANSDSLNFDQFVPVFHRWIQTQALPGHQLIDVANYEHVHEGPGVLLVAHEANLHADQGKGKPGLLYRRKYPTTAGSFRGRLRTTFGHALEAAALLENDAELAGRANIRTDEATFMIFDRLLAPNSTRTFKSIRDDLEAFLTGLFQTSTIELDYVENPQEIFEVSIRSGQTLSASALLDRVVVA